MESYLKSKGDLYRLESMPTPGDQQPDSPPHRTVTRHRNPSKSIKLMKKMLKNNPSLLYEEIDHFILKTYHEPTASQTNYAGKYESRNSSIGHAKGNQFKFPTCQT